MTSVLLVPGLWNSGPQHWQTHWEAKHPDWPRIQQRDWDRPDRDEWVRTLDETVARMPSPVVIAAHSLGCVLVAQWVANGGGDRAAGAFLVAPSDAEAPGYPEEGRSFDKVPLVRLPFPSIVVASSNDEYVALRRAEDFANAWGSRFVNIEPAGHINGASGYGPWPAGEQMFIEFCDRVSRAS